MSASTEIKDQDYLRWMMTNIIQEVDRVFDTYGTPPAQDYRPANQAPGPCQTTQELMQILSKGRGQARREELHRYRTFGARTRSLQSCIQ